MDNLEHLTIKSAYLTIIYPTYTALTILLFKKLFYIARYKIDLKLQGEKNVFYLTGIALDESEVKA